MNIFVAIGLWFNRRFRILITANRLQDYVIMVGDSTTRSHV